ncbi:MAG: long-chain fatty acid--CoA ligase [Alphaproteobacteria bacterium]|nr:long-chain fatty acid--CoA ligase [Alphaproteobacteria bacterium]
MTAPTLSPAMPWIEHYPHGLDWHDPVPQTAVFDMLSQAQKTYGDRPAFDFLGYRQSWSQIHGQALHFAKGLESLGVRKGTKVGICLPNCPYFVIAYYAIARLGATVVNYNPLYAEAELARMIEDSETDIMVTTDLEMLFSKTHKMLHDTRLGHIIICPFTDILPFPKNILFKLIKGRELANITPSKRISFYPDMLVNDGTPSDVQIIPHQDIAVFQYTGGTTGTPKGAMLTHANVTANAYQCARWFRDAKSGQDKMVGVIPFFHVFAMTAVMNMSVVHGLEIIALPRFDLDATLKLIHKKKPQIFPAVPAIFNAINHHKKLSTFNLSSLKYCVSGGAPLPVEVKQSFESKTGASLVEGYGLTESAPVLCCNPPGGLNKPGSIGLPFPQTTIQIISTEDHETVMKQGERGELCARGPQVMAGYWNRADESANVLRYGRLHTGDVAVMDEQGYFYIVDRIKDLIITNGYNVYPRHVEEAIYLHPSVEECIVAGLPDSQRGEIVKAWIKLKEGRQLSPEDLKMFLEDKISAIEMPKRFEFRDTPLPKTMIGKLSRKDVLAQEKQSS